MFKLFKDKIKEAFNKFSKEVDVNSEAVEGEEETKEDILEEALEEKEIVEKELEEEQEKDESEENSEEQTDDSEETKDEKKGFFAKLFKKKEKEEPKPIDEKSEAEHALSVDELEDEEEPVLKEEEIEIPENIPDDLSDEDLELVDNKIKKTIDAIKKQSDKLLKRDEEESKEKPVEEKETTKEAPKKEEKKVEAPTEKKGFLQKLSDSITKKVLSESAFNEIFWDLEITLLENNVAVEVIDLIKENLKEELVNKPIQRKNIPETIEKTLRKTVEEIFELDGIDFLGEIPNKKPYKILIVGVNGSGKTTTIGKLVKLIQDNKYTTVLAAADTFRAAAIDQIEEHANNLGVKLIKHDYNSDPAAVAFDAIKYAESKKLDTVIIDTAGRLHSNSNLMDELKKVYRVSKPDLTIFIGESITGNDCIEQAKEFQKAVEFDGIILSKADVDEKGGTAISISYVTRKPILYLGVGQEYKDLEEFDKYKIMYRMFGADIGQEE